MKTGQAVLYIADLAELLGRTEAAIRSAHQRGSIPGAFTLLGRTAWHRADIEAWLDGATVENKQTKETKKDRKRQSHTVQLRAV